MCRMPQMIWSHPRASSYYMNSKRRIFLSWPWRRVDIINQNRPPAQCSYVLQRRRAEPAGATHTPHGRGFFFLRRHSKTTHAQLGPAQGHIAGGGLAGEGRGDRRGHAGAVIHNADAADGIGRAEGPLRLLRQLLLDERVVVRELVRRRLHDRRED